MMSIFDNRHVLIIIFLLSSLLAQSTTQFYHKNPNQVNAGDDIVLSVTMFAKDPIISGILFFRSIGQINYQEVSMNFIGGNWKGVIPVSYTHLTLPTICSV